MPDFGPWTVPGVAHRYLVGPLMHSRRLAFGAGDESARPTPARACKGLKMMTPRMV